MTRPTISTRVTLPRPRVRPLRDLPGCRLTSLPDVRGWAVVLDGGVVVGLVERIFVDLRDREARYLDIGLDGRVVARAAGRSWRVLVPVGRARLPAEANVVRLPGLSLGQVAELPDTPPFGVTREVESWVLRWFAARPPHGDDGFYASEAFKVSALMAERRGPGEAPG